MMRKGRLLVAALGVLVLSTGLSHATVSPAAKCAAAKMKAAAKKMNSKFKCYEKAALAGTVADSACLMDAQNKFFSAIFKAEQQPGCPNTGDESTIEQAVDTGIASVIALAPAIALCPSTAHEGDACGSCGSGTCLLDVDGSTLACSNVTPEGICSSDVSCTAGSQCINVLLGDVCFPGCP
jgi:hypothetical protein